MTITPKWINKFSEEKRLEMKSIEFYIRKRFREEKIPEPERLLPCWAMPDSDPEECYQGRKRVWIIELSKNKKFVDRGGK